MNTISVKPFATLLSLLVPFVLWGCNKNGDEDLADDLDPNAIVDPWSAAETFRRIISLEPHQYENTLRHLGGSGVDAGNKLLAVSPKRNAGNIPDADTRSMGDSYLPVLEAVARESAAEIIPQLKEEFPCLNSEPDEACATEVIRSFGKRAFRRPLRTEEVDSYRSFYDDSDAEGTDTALEQVLTAFLMSPNTIFRTEIGDEESQEDNSTTMTSYERASSLAYFLTDAPPDEALMEAADNDALLDGASIKEHVQRLSNDPNIATGLVAFMRTYTFSKAVVGAVKDPDRFPSFGNETSAALSQETELLFMDAVWGESQSLHTLLTANHSFINSDLNPIYKTNAGRDFEKTVIPDEMRRGFLSLGALMATYATEKESDIVHRGIFLREEMLCQELPPPPPNVSEVPENAEDLTQREQLAIHRKDPSCAGCHNLIDPLAYPLEPFDAVGAFRTKDNGHTIDSSGEISGVSGGPIAVSDTVDFLETFGALPEVARCFLWKMRASSLKRPGLPKDQVSSEEETIFENTDRNIRESLAEMLSRESMYQRFTYPEEDSEQEE